MLKALLQAQFRHARAAPALLNLRSSITSNPSSTHLRALLTAAAYTCSTSAAPHPQFSPAHFLIAAGALGAASAALLYHSQAEHPPNAAGDPSLPPPPKHGWSILSTRQQQHVFFKYEKRIRELSSLEKIFDYFASQERDGVKYMAPEDILRSIVATYPPYGSDTTRSGCLQGEHRPNLPEPKVNTIFQQIDIDGDQLVSFAEYLLLLALLSIPLGDIATVFRLVDIDGNDELDAAELAAVLQLLQIKAGLGRTNPRTGRHTGHKALLLEKPVGLFTYFFGENLKGRVGVPQLMEFLSALHDQQLLLEFAHYDFTSSGTITLADAAASLAASCRIYDVDHLLERIQTLPPDIAATRITLPEFQELSKLHCHPDVDHVVTALEFMAQLGRPMTPPDIERLLAAHLGIRLSPQGLQMLFHLFGDDKGELDWRLLVDVLRRRNLLPGHRGPPATDKSVGLQGGIGAYLECIKACVQNQAVQE